MIFTKKEVPWAMRTLIVYTLYNIYIYNALLLLYRYTYIPKSKQ